MKYRSEVSTNCIERSVYLDSHIEVDENTSVPNVVNIRTNENVVVREVAMKDVLFNQ